MGWEHEPETVWKAQELYCVDRLSFARVAELTGVSATTLKAWSDKYGWRAKREEIAQAESDIRVNVIKGRKLALDKLLEAESAKQAAPMAFAVASLESLALKQAELAAAGKIPNAAQQAPAVRVTTREEAVTALREAVERKLNAALNAPERITAETVKDVSRCLELVAELEAKTATTEQTAPKVKGLSPENVQAIREILEG